MSRATNPRGVVQAPRKPFPTHFYYRNFVGGAPGCGLCGRDIMDGVHRFTEARILKRG